MSSTPSNLVFGVVRWHLQLSTALLVYFLLMKPIVRKFREVSFLTGQPSRLLWIMDFVCSFTSLFGVDGCRVSRTAEMPSPFGTMLSLVMILSLPMRRLPSSTRFSCHVSGWLSLYQSLLSLVGGASEFAKRFWGLSKDLSPISVKSLLTCTSVSWIM